jgi:translation initiation factor 2B subunit (eIF-2B alpha/beta/delta family)
MDNLEQRIALVRNDRDHGSSWLARQAISILHDLAADETSPADERMQQVRKAALALAYARPAMAALAVAVGRILSAPGGLPGIAQEAASLLKEYDSAVERIATYARPLLSGTLMVHSLSGTVLEVLTACATQIERVIVLEGRPRYEGRDMARALSERGIAITLLTDAQADIFLLQCHAIVVGADSVLANGDVLNKAGTALLAWAAHGHKVPFYVLCETLKISPRSWSGDLAQLEEKEPQEVLEQPIKGVTVRNFYFDRTPAKLVTRVVTEQGLMGRREIKRVAARAMHDEQALTRIIHQ